MEVQGEVAPGFEPVREVFAASLLSGEEIGAAVCVYHQGERVVDLWGGLADPTTRRRWTADTLAISFSTTKGLAATALLLLVEDGRLDLDAPVASIWPEFAANGKADITTRDILNHRAGLTALDQPLRLTDFADRERVHQALVAQRPLWRPGAAQGYAATAIGAYLQEIVWRLTGMSLGRLVRERLAGPAQLDLYLGLKDAPAHAKARERLARLVPYGRRTLFTQVIPEALTRRSTEGRLFRRVIAGRRTTAGRALLNPAMGPERLAALNAPEVQDLELPWMNAAFSARSLAGLYRFHAEGGQVGGLRLFQPATLQPLHRRQSWSQRDRVLGKPVGFSQGFLKEELNLFSPVLESYGHAGVGGSLGWADPRHGLAIGYVLNALDWRLRSPRALRLTHALYRALGQRFPFPAWMPE